MTAYQSTGNTPTNPTVQQRAASAYAAAGLTIIPLWPGKKKPRAAGWQAATTPTAAPWLDPDHPHFDPRNNIGCHVGASGLIVLDVDLKYPAAGEWLDARLAEHGEQWLETVVHNTGNGGLHLFFLPADCGIDTTIVNLDGCHIDLLAGKRQAVMPGSVLLYGSDDEPLAAPRPYKRADGSPSITDLAAATPTPIPAWLVAACRLHFAGKAATATAIVPQIATRKLDTASEQSRRGKWGEAALLGALDDLARAAQGGRNDALNGKAYHVGRIARDAGLTISDVERQFSVVAAAIGLPPYEVSSTLRSGLEAGLSAPRHVALTPPTARRPFALVTPQEVR